MAALGDVFAELEKQKVEHLIVLVPSYMNTYWEPHLASAPAGDGFVRGDPVSPPFMHNIDELAFVRDSVKRLGLRIEIRWDSPPSKIIEPIVPAQPPDAR